MDLTLRELAEPLAELSDHEQPFGVHVLASTEPAAELGRAVEQEVFAEFFGNTPDLLTAEYAPYEPASIFLCVVDHRRLVPAGVMRLIVPSPHGQKSLDDIQRVWGQPVEDVIARSHAAIDRERCWDIATLAVAPEYRGAGTEGLVSLALYQALVGMATAADVPWFFAVLDVAVLDLISERMAQPFTRFEGLEPKSYLDSPASLPAFVDLGPYEVRIREHDRAIYDILFGGTGLEAAVWTADWDDAVHRSMSSLGLLGQEASVTSTRPAPRS
jgi:hypothetical protein